MTDARMEAFLADILGLEGENPDATTPSSFPILKRRLSRSDEGVEKNRGAGVPGGFNIQMMDVMPTEDL